MESPLISTFGERLESFPSSTEDYAKIRHRLSNRLQKLRRALKIQTKDTKNYRAKEKTSSISPEDYEKDTRFGDLLLYLIERDLVFVEEITYGQIEYSRTTKTLTISKLKKARQHAKHLLSLLANEQDDLKLLAILILASYVEGRLAFSRSKWAEAAFALSVARCSLQYLSQTETSDLYTQIIEGYIDSELKICALKLENDRNPDLLQFSKTYATKDTITYLSKAINMVKAKDGDVLKPISKTTLVDSVSWFEFSAPLKDLDLARAITKAQTEEKNVVETDPASFDRSFLLWTDASNSHKSSLKGGIESDDDENQDKYVIMTYIDYHQLLLRIRRNISLLNRVNAKLNKKKTVSKAAFLENAKECVKLYEDVISSFKELTELSGVAHNESLHSSLVSLQVYFSALKAYKLAKSYLISNKYAESLALLNKTVEILKEVKPLEEEFEGGIPNNEEIEKFRSESTSLFTKVHVLTMYFTKENHKPLLGDYLIDNVDAFPDLTNEELLAKIADLDARVKPVGVKPVLFDVAFNYIGYDSDLSKVSAGDSKSEKKAGFFGLFGR
ncbi:hypothetical protein KL918_000727 [Ogataea parapolymorpha]|uniref:Signal recognition particle subunit SRP68 n=1 Tax=Ogataea parapolymorpha (strain ATCC 26012 / BCRC 20466 / JCM 22074 / NRRL Y-7560 / DL-1) TaxID=871575 RepID=W1QBQ8_OGAPD|nr:Signal recognition particle subunit SRP68 [Ogataea parapolymorpha DL-1]ESW97117.1 Signal recognition particle subunit SRP68 [Ogataea parapolymorpha DL-1]KAG7869182.1 hypothetical protein KL918_000727 [Ogataea parapolymorpha]KAG7875767.1 hypothetical protein KL916_000438 [Ogataea parapolymorpha]